MYLRALLLLFIAAALLGKGAMPAHAAWARSPCGDTRVGWNPQCCYYGYCSSSRLCWVTETGIGVCATVRHYRAQTEFYRVLPLVSLQRQEVLITKEAHKHRTEL